MSAHTEAVADLKKLRDSGSLSDVSTAVLVGLFGMAKSLDRSTTRIAELEQALREACDMAETYADDAREYGSPPVEALDRLRALLPPAPEVKPPVECASGPDCALCAPRRVFRGFVDEEFWHVGEINSGVRRPALVERLGENFGHEWGLDEMFHDLHGEEVTVTIDVHSRAPAETERRVLIGTCATCRHMYRDGGDVLCDSPNVVRISLQQPPDTFGCIHWSSRVTVEDLGPSGKEPGR